MKAIDRIIERLTHWLLIQEPPRHAYLCDFQKVGERVCPGDVLLIEGRTRVSRVIRQITQSPWTHAALYIGRLQDIQDEGLKERIRDFYKGDESTQLLIESEIGLGTVVTPIEKYHLDHIRILRPTWITELDIQRLITFAIRRLGRAYNLRHLLDLARFLFPWGLYPRQWRSTLFEHNALQPTKDICSSMIAEAFESINYPILPLIEKNKDNELRVIRRNPRLYTPSDFDYSPFFSVIKYPIFSLKTKGGYVNLPWSDDKMSNK